MRKVIMAVDDEDSVLRSLSRVFKNRHYDFISFNSPVDALLSLSKIKPHVIISDKRMPHIQGIDFLSRAKTISQKSLRILLTGFNLPEDLSEKHIDKVMTKPWLNDEIEYEVSKTTVHPDKIIVPVFDSEFEEFSHGCIMCGAIDITHELRFDRYSDYICDNCRSKLITYTGSSLEPMMMKHMLGNVI